MDETPDLAGSIVDPGSFQPFEDGLRSRDPLGYPEYRTALERAAAKAGTDEAIVVGEAQVEGREIELALFRFPFMGGSMGEVVGERLARSMERTAERQVPFVMRTETGGARMQEGMRSLIQMPKVVAARMALADMHQPLIAVLGHPTTGGVLASLAASADFIVAEEGATMGFAGPRVAERFTGEKLPVDSHTADAALQHGLIDAVLPAAEIRRWLSGALWCLQPDDPQDFPDDRPPQASGPRLTPDDALASVRDPTRARGRALLHPFSFPFVELRGDRAGADDPAVITGLMRVGGRRALVIALDGALSPGPAGFRKARRALELAERLDIPVVTLVDTLGADPSASSEAGGIAWEISALFEKMLGVTVPVLSVVTGEGGSGGALAFATADRLVIYEDATFSVIAPEGAAEILWKDAQRVGEAARLLHLTAHDLMDLGVADALAPAPLDARSIHDVVAYHLDQICREEHADISVTRRNRWRSSW